MCTIRERTNSFAAFCNWLRELSSSIKELFSTTNTPAIYGRMMELESCQIQLQTSLIELENSLINLKNNLN